MFFTLLNVHVGSAMSVKPPALSNRISEHKSSNRRNDRDHPVAVHFNDLRQDISTFLDFCGIEKVKKSDRGGDINNTPS